MLMKIRSSERLPKIRNRVKGCKAAIEHKNIRIKEGLLRVGSKSKAKPGYINLPKKMNKENSPVGVELAVNSGSRFPIKMKKKLPIMVNVIPHVNKRSTLQIRFLLRLLKFIYLTLIIS